MISKVEFAYLERSGRLYSIKVYTSKRDWYTKVSKNTLERILRISFGMEYEVPEEYLGWSSMEKECSFLNYATNIEFRHDDTMDIS
jgi:hypothetical protein